MLCSSKVSLYTTAWTCCLVPFSVPQMQGFHKQENFYAVECWMSFHANYLRHQHAHSPQLCNLHLQKKSCKCDYMVHNPVKIIAQHRIFIEYSTNLLCREKQPHLTPLACSQAVSQVCSSLPLLTIHFLFNVQVLIRNVHMKVARSHTLGSNASKLLLVPVSL